MRYRTAVASYIIAIACSAQFSSKDIKGMERMLDEAPLKGYVTKLNERYPGMATELGKLPMQAISDPALKEALRLDKKGTTGPYPSTDSSCALVRLTGRGKDEWARVNYIFLSKQSGTDEELHVRADSILQAIRNGWSFSDAALQYSMDGNAKRGGDLGWFTRSMMVPEFSGPVFQHHKGDLFTAAVGIYGWYVVEVTEEPGSYEHVEYILGRGPICR
ncbi:MAG: peptidylprolyl isomerase [Flavobacteriales bacterium]|nr:peptidylprolyl isomerase [Flavobacteriales bacterium]